MSIDLGNRWKTQVDMCRSTSMLRCIRSLLLCEFVGCGNRQTSQEARTINYQRFLVPSISCTSAMAVLLIYNSNIPSWWLCTFPRLLWH